MQSIVGTAIKTISVFLVALGLYALDEPLSAQDQMYRNRSKLKITIETDRPEYFPRETVGITISVANPTSKTLTIPAPISYYTGSMDILRCLHGSSRDLMCETMASDPYTQPSTTARKTPSTVIKPGEVLTRKFRSFETGITSRIESASEGAAPRVPGDYRFVYWGAEANFRVILPNYEGMIKIPWPEWDERPTGPPESKTVRAQKMAYVFMLGWADKHYICLMRDPYSGRIGEPRVGKLMYSEFQIYRYSRVAESLEPVIELKGAADPSGNLRLTWGASAEHTLFVDRNEFASPVR